jgi:hypothetical protein
VAQPALNAHADRQGHPAGTDQVPHGSGLAGVLLSFNLFHVDFFVD